MKKIRKFLQKNQSIWGFIEKGRRLQRSCQYLWATLFSFKSIPTSTTLMLLAKTGKVSEVEKLLSEGVDVNVQDDRGQTALHYAVKCGQSQVAACLLSYDADHALTDHYGNIPLSLNYINIHLLHAIRQRYRRFIKISQESKYENKEPMIAWLDDLKKNGVVKISGLIDNAELIEMQQEFCTFVEEIKQREAEGNINYKHYDDEEHWRPEEKIFTTNNAFKYSKQLINLCCKPTLLEVARQYYGRDVVISRGVAMRYLPGGGQGNEQFHWHHDMEEKRLKMMVLLTDIGEDDKCMNYALGTHKLFHPYSMFFNNEYDLNYAAKQVNQIKIENTIGKAGDIFLFDSNGAHRGNHRRNENIRDTYFVEFSDDTNNIWGGDISENYFVSNPVTGLNPFNNFLSVDKKWEKKADRDYCDWVTDMPYPERWLRKGIM